MSNPTSPNKTQKLWLSDRFVTWLFWSLGVLVALGIIIFAYAIYLTIGNPSLSFKNNDLYEMLIAIGATAGGIVLTINAVYIGKRADAQDKSVKTQAEANEQNLFNKAIEHLGSEKESVRIGGIYALHKLAKGESTKEDYLANVRNILCAHIRSKTNEERYKETYKYEPSIEIQSLLHVFTIGDGSKVFKGQSLNFSGANLQGAGFYKAQLQMANFFNAQLQTASFSNANLQGAYFSKANLQMANFANAQLQGTYFADTELQNANFSEAHLQAAYFSRAHIQNAKFFNANLQGVYSSDLAKGISFFQDIVQERVNQPADMKGAIIIGGVTRDDIEEMREYIAHGEEYWSSSDKDALTDLLKDLEKNHVGTRVFGLDNDELSKLSCYKSAQLGAYSNKEAEEMIEEHKKGIVINPTK